MVQRKGTGSKNVLRPYKPEWTVRFGLHRCRVRLPAPRFGSDKYSYSKLANDIDTKYNRPITKENLMRINVYSQELTKEVQIISTVAKDTGIAYKGVRMYLASPDILHHTQEDDDRSAITFWIPHAESFTSEDLALLFEEMAAQVRIAG